MNVLGSSPSARNRCWYAVVVCCLWTTLGFAQSPPANDRIREFGPGEDELLIPGFGGAGIKYPYTLDDRQDAERLLERYDRNRDGGIDRAETERMRWSREDLFDLDLNGDGKLNLIELAQREARERTGGREGRRRRSESYSLLKPRETARPNRTEEPDFRSRRSSGDSNRSSREMAYGIFGRYDRNRDRRLDTIERRDLGINMSQADTNGDGQLNMGELDTWVFRQIEDRMEDLSDILPEWFFEKDQNGDGQIEMAEYESQWTQESVDAFASVDANSDGVITSKEVLHAKTFVGGAYTSDEAAVLPPRSTMTSEIEVTDDFEIGKLRVRLSITHTYLSQLAARLTGPDGEVIELFSGNGGSDDNFEGTIFDDEADTKISRGKAPFRGSFQPRAVEKKQKSLSHYKGQNVRGVWQLSVVANRSERFGILHSWSLLATPPVAMSAGHVNASGEP